MKEPRKQTTKQKWINCEYTQGEERNNDNNVGKKWRDSCPGYLKPSETI